MCIICIDLVRGKIHYKDALSNMAENISNIEQRHVEKILDLVTLKKEQELLKLKEEQSENEEEETFL